MLKRVSFLILGSFLLGSFLVTAATACTPLALTSPPALSAGIARTCSEKNRDAVFSVLPSCGEGCDPLAAICASAGIDEPECEDCIAQLLAAGKALECAAGAYCWPEH